MKKFFRILLKTIAVIGLTIVLLLAIVFIVNIICNKIEQGKIEHYGQLITVNEGKMNVTIQGKGQKQSSYYQASEQQHQHLILSHLSKN